MRPASDWYVTLTIPFALGTSRGEASLPMAVSSAPSVLRLRRITPDACAGSQSSYEETAVVSIDANGAGSITMMDTPGFNRQYNGTLTASGTFMSQGSFPFFGASIPGQLSWTFTDSSHATMSETTTYGTCSNPYTPSLTKQ